MLFTEGFHGTDETTARRILEVGFNPDKQLFLAAVVQTYLAHEHGEVNALRSRSDNYGIIRVTIPETPITQSMLGPGSLQLFGAEIELAVIESISVYNLSRQLLEGDEIPLTHDPDYFIPSWI